MIKRYHYIFYQKWLPEVLLLNYYCECLATNSEDLAKKIPKSRYPSRYIEPQVSIFFLSHNMILN